MCSDCRPREYPYPEYPRIHQATEIWGKWKTPRKIRKNGGKWKKMRENEGKWGEMTKNEKLVDS